MRAADRVTADRPPELRGTGANQAVDQIKLYGSAVRWFCEAGVPEARVGMAAYWRSLACNAWAHAAGAAGGLPGPVHVNVPLAEPLVPDGDPGWPEPLNGRPDGAAWTQFGGRHVPRSPAGTTLPGSSGACRRRLRRAARRADVDLPDAARGVLICGDGTPDPAGLAAAAADAGWPVLAEPSSGARTWAAAHSPPIPTCSPRRISSGRMSQRSSLRPEGPDYQASKSHSCTRPPGTS